MDLTIQINDDRITQLGLDAEIDFCRSMAVEQLACNEVVGITVGLVDPVLNVVIDTQATESTIEEKINAVIQFFKQHQVDWTWVVGPLSRPPTLPSHLQRQGFSLVERYPGMYADLTNPLPTGLLENLMIQEVSSEDELTEWIKPIREAFPSSDRAEGYRKLNAKIPHGKDTVFHHYIGYYQNKPVTAGTLFISKATVMIHNLATIPDFRGQGFGTALTVHIMQKAKDLDFKHCFLDSSESGFNIYRKIGFQVYCVYGVYGLKQ